MRSLVTLALAMIFAIGCGGAPVGPKMYLVSGTLTVGGKAVPDVNVQIVPADLSTGKIISTGKTDKSGRFNVMGSNGQPGCAPGKYKVVLAVPTAAPEPGKAHNGAPPEAAALPFPTEYSSAATSPKSLDVTDKAVTLDLSL